MKIKAHRAPWLERIQDRIVVLVTPAIRIQLQRLLKANFETAYFLKKLEEGKQLTIINVADKDPANPKLLRLITLLSELGTLLERVIQIIFVQISEKEFFYENRYGLGKSKFSIGTIGALVGHIKQ